MAPQTRSQASAASLSSASASPSPAPSSCSLPNLNDHNQSSDRPTLVILGTGWAGFSLYQALLRRSTSSSWHFSSVFPCYRIILISPMRTLPLTPLLASAACGLFDFRLAEEPIRRWEMEARGVEKYQASVSAVDLQNKTVRCRPVVSEEGGGLGVDLTNEDFSVAFDKLVICPGNVANTFGIDGVEEHAVIVTDVPSSRRLRARILDCLELASLPSHCLSAAQRHDLLHIAIIGGGPTGIEIAAEIDELIHLHLRHIYPKEVIENFTISIYDVKDNVLQGVFSEEAQKYAMKRLGERKGVSIKTNATIQKLGRGWIETKEEGRQGVGLCVWAVGGKPGELVEGMTCGKVAGRIATDDFLRVLMADPVTKEGKKRESRAVDVFEEIYALGDAADIHTDSLPTTAEVAVQKGEWLAQHLHSSLATPREKGSSSLEHSQPFVFTPHRQKAYLGREDGIVEGRGRTDGVARQWTGKSAWLAWRSGNLEWNRSWRRRMMMCCYWVLNWVDGRELARR